MTTAGTETRTLGQKIVDRFMETMIERMEQVKSVGWRKGWIGSAIVPGTMPQNISGRGYSGSNSFSLQLNMAFRGYSMPVYLTFKQVNDMRVYVKEGESAMPMFYWDIVVRDKDGKKVFKEAYRKMSPVEWVRVQTIPFLGAFNMFSVDQANLTEVKPDKMEAFEKLLVLPELRDAGGVFTSKTFDRISKKQEWIHSIQYDKQVSGVYLFSFKDIIAIPKKEQSSTGKTLEEIYKDSMEYYSTALHETAHSTDTEPRLNRGSHEKLGDMKYAKEELVTELTAAMVGNSMGLDKRILDNNAAYLDSWIPTLRENPKFIVPAMADVNKVTNMILEEVDKQKMAPGGEPLLNENRNLSNDILEDKAIFKNASIIKQDDSNYAV